jgi:hypothetical protein
VLRTFKDFLKESTVKTNLQEIESMIAAAHAKAHAKNSKNAGEDATFEAKVTHVPASVASKEKKPKDTPVVKQKEPEKFVVQVTKNGQPHSDDGALITTGDYPPHEFFSRVFPLCHTHRGIPIPPAKKYISVPEVKQFKPETPIKIESHG